MELNLEIASTFKDTIEAISLKSIISYAQTSYPNECCGFVLENGIVQPARNVIDKLGNLALTQKNAFLMDGESWNLAIAKNSPIACIYHSHTNGVPDMSIADKAYLQWKQVFYIIIALVDHAPTVAKLFWWEGDGLKELTLQI